VWIGLWRNIVQSSELEGALALVATDVQHDRTRIREMGMAISHLFLPIAILTSDYAL
jgi:hypothetical protein